MIKLNVTDLLEKKCKTMFFEQIFNFKKIQIIFEFVSFIIDF